MEKLYTISEVADKLGLSTKTLRRWEESGKFLGNRTLGNQRRYNLTDLQILDAIKHGIINGSDDLLTIDQAAKLFGVSPTTIARWEESGKIHPLITAGITYYPRHRLLAKMDLLRAEPVAPLYHEPIIETSYTPTPAPTAPVREEVIPPRHLTPFPTDLKHATLGSAFLKPMAFNLIITFLLLLTYHLIINKPNSKPLASPSSQTESTSSTRDPVLLALDSLLDSAGNLKSRSLTTNSLSLSPASPPTAVPGTLYFDAGTETVMVYKNNSWTPMDAGNTTAGTGLIKKGQDQTSINSPTIKDNSIVHITFGSDYAPARKYWVTVGDGSFTVHTDSPVAEVSPFTYLLVMPK